MNLKFFTFLALIFLIFNSGINAQEFTKAYGNANSNVINSGRYSASHQAYFALGTENDKTITITKIDLNGNVIWSKKYSGNYNSFELAEIKVPNRSTTDIILTLSDYGTYYDLYVMRVNGDNGSVVWNKKVKYPSENRFANFVITNDNNIVAATTIRGGGLFLAKLNLLGEVLWAKTIDRSGDFQKTSNFVPDNKNGFLFGFQDGINGIIGISFDGIVNFAYKNNNNSHIRIITKHPTNGYIISSYLDWNNRATNNELIYINNDYNIVWKKLINPTVNQSGYCVGCSSPYTVVNKQGEIISISESAISGEIKFNFSKFNQNGEHINSVSGNNNDLQYLSSGYGANNTIFSLGTTTRENLCLTTNKNGLFSAYKDNLEICDTKSFTPKVTNSTTTLTELLTSSFNIQNTNYTVSNINTIVSDNILKARNLCSGQEEKVNLGADISTCTSGNITLNAGTGYKSYQWSNGATSASIQTNASGTFWVKATDDCDRISRDTIKVTISSPSSKTQSISICTGQTYKIGKNTYSIAGTYKDTLTSSNKCDSIITTVLTIKQNSTKVQSFAICQGDSVKVGNSIYKTAGTFKDILTAKNGCDSTITTTISFKTCGATINGTVNKYSPVTDISCSKLVVEKGSLFAKGDRVLVIQMQGAQVDTSNTINFGTIIDYRNAGNYEFNTINNVSGNNIELVFSLKNNYDLDGHVQLVYIPTYTDISINGKLTGQAWDGKSGGIIAIEASGIVTLNANIDATGIGFRGGITVNGIFDPGYCFPDPIYNTLASKDGGHKGEGIAVWNTNKILNRGAWANGGGGGNIHNGGGGGGALYSKGGQGGKIYQDPGFPLCEGGNGLGANELIWQNNKIYMGGGGGSGHDNDRTSFPGGNGGGIIIIKSSNLVLNNYNIVSNGITPKAAGNDGASGGGAGGSIIIESQIQANTGKIEAKGANGANNDWISYRQCVAPGGGGAGGFIQLIKSIPANNYSIENGLSGRISVNNPICSNSQFGAEDGQIGKIEYNASLNYSSTILNSSIDTLIIESFICDYGNYTLPNGVIVSSSGIWNTLLKNTEGCDSIFIKTILENQPTYFLDLGEDTTLCYGEFLTLGLNIQAENYIWSNGSTQPTIEAEAPGTYSLTISNVCGNSTDTIVLNAIDCDCNVFIPNAFSPNGDGKNDVLIIKEENIISSNFMIYNKWGEEVFKSKNNDQNWNGANKDKQLPPDVYGYFYEGTCIKGNKMEYKGNITIVR